MNIYLGKILKDFMSFIELYKAFLPLLDHQKSLPINEAFPFVW